MKAFRIALGLMIATAVVSVVSCVKKDYDGPPDARGNDPNTPVNMTIAELKSKFVGPAATMIDSDWTIYGVVTADDKSGNLYQQINIEDSTGGITVLIQGSGLYGRYPVGRKLYIKLKGLYYGFYSKLPQIGYTPDGTGSMSNIPTTLSDNFIIRASYPNPVVPQHFSDLSALKTVNVNMLNRLVQIDSVEFIATDTSKTYAVDPAIASGTSVTLEDCSGNTLVVRTSGYANFATTKLPKGKGSLVALYTTYNTTPQLVLRDTTDLQFTAPRCGGGGSGTPGGTILLSESFSSGTNNTDINLNGWTNFAEAGGKKYQFSNAGSSSNPYAKITAYQSGQSSVISWLVTPVINLNGVTNPILTFKSADGFDNGATMKLYVSTNFSGDVASATWTQVNANFAPSSASGYSPFTSSGSISLSSFIGNNIAIAFKYEGSDPSQSTTWEIDEVNVTAN